MARPKTTCCRARSTALLANPSHQALDLVWNPPRDDRVTGFELRWRGVEADEWRSQIIPHDNRFQVSDLDNGARYVFQMRALAGGRESQWPQSAGYPCGGQPSGIAVCLPVRCFNQDHPETHLLRSRTRLDNEVSTSMAELHR
ncbi:MAG: hypothetical protein AMJ93_01170 [Anaerolineae bacterium SM23_84]|nr:MAG: hypothetical protein AMJ93_01170 [Anaerolineae bacterium SM23_84]